MDAIKTDMGAARPGETRTGIDFITGGSGGIGAAIARRLARAGRPVAITYHKNRQKAEVLAEEIDRTGGNAVIAMLDLRDADGVRETMDAVAARNGGIGGLITAHGPFINMQYMSELPPSLLQETFQDDTFAAYNAIHAAIPHLRETKGAIVSLVTAAIRRYAATDILSVAPKAAIEAFARGVAVEEGKFGIRANAVGVGLIEDGMFDALEKAGYFTESFLETSRRNTALRRFGTADEIAELVEFLLSGRSSFITGQAIMADGGYAV